MTERISVFTGVHAPTLPFLQEAYDSLKAQTYTDWKWVLVPNGGATIPDEIATDNRVKVYPYPGEPKGVGEIKAFACERACGEILVELDADDILTPDALEALAAAFADRNVAFAYSNTVEFENETWKPNTYDAAYGWRERPFEWQGRDLIELLGWEPGPHMLRLIYWAPNHVRAWRAMAYQALGGHHKELEVCDDHDLLVRTYLVYGAAGMHHIDRPLYLERIHDQNTVKTRNAKIQEVTRDIQWVYSQKLAERWARDEGLRLLDLGGGLNPASGYEVVDVRSEADLQVDLNGAWPFEDGSVGVLRASHLVEHLRDPVHTMNEAYRVLAPGGWFFIEVPSTDGRGAFQDPTHVSFWNQNSFWYYTQREKAVFAPEFRGRFQASLVETYFPDQWWRDNLIPVVRADLIALKSPYDERPPGGVLI